jgi:hypothetical protein
MRIRAQSQLRFVWAFAIFWNLVAAPATFLGAVPAIRQGKPIAWVALIFPFAGAALLIWAVRLSLRFWRFGVSWLTLETGSVTLGGPLRARIEAPRLPEDSTVNLMLTCINRVVTGSGSDRSTWDKVVWQEQQTVARESLEPGPEGEIVPVSFRLPFDAPPTRSDNPNDRIVWRLEANARLAGVDYDEQFEVPVAAALPGKTPDREAETASVPAPARPETSRIVVEPDPAGGVRFLLPPGRNVGATMVMAMFASIFCGGGALFLFLLRSGLHGNPFGVFVGSVILAVLAPFILLLVLITLHTAFLRTSVSAGPAGLAVTSHVLGLSWSSTATTREVGEITLKVNMQVGMTPYYDLKIARATGRPLTISAMLRDKREAEWLAAEIKRSLR